MTIIVENGTVVANANSYVSVVDADTYFLNRNNSVWASLDPVIVKPACLIQAQDYMLQAYRTRWQGFRTTINQTLDWPRFEVMSLDAPGGYGPAPYFYPPNVIPQEIINAQCELAVRASQSELAPDIDRIEKSVKVGGITVDYDNDFAPVVSFRAVDLLLRPFFTGFGTRTTTGRG